MSKYHKSSSERNSPKNKSIKKFADAEPQTFDDIPPATYRAPAGIYPTPEHLKDALVNVNTGDYSKINKNSEPVYYNTDLTIIRKAWHNIFDKVGDNLEHIPLEPGSDYNKKFKWYPSDSEDTFKNNIKDDTGKKLMRKLGWLDDNNIPKDIFYNINECGFRCKNFSTVQNPGIMTLGCSFTFGVGLPIEDTFTQKVADHFDLENFNLSTPGRGLDFLSLYVSLFLQHELNPELIKAIVVYLPPPGRETIFSYKGGFLGMADLHNDVLNDSGWYTDSTISDLEFVYDDKDRTKIDKYRSGLWEHLMITKENHFKRDMQSLNTIKLFCLEHDIPLVIASKTSLLSTTIDFARDLMHFGPNTNTVISKELISKLNKVLHKHK